VAATWHKADPAFFERTKEETLAAYPELAFELRGDVVWLTGPFRLMHGAEEVERYDIAIRLPNDFPESVPDLFETGGKIRRHADEHTYNNGRACLFVEGERWIHWPPGSTLVDFLNGPVRSHLVGHLHYKVEGFWPFGQRAHGAAGIVEAYSEMIGINDRAIVEAYLDVLCMSTVKGHVWCPCRSGRRLRSCHRDQVIDLRGKISTREATAARKHLLFDNGNGVGAK
jgi:hypothetical protein